MNATAVYHWFDEPKDSPPYANLRVPIIVSIATLRAVNPTIPILVLAKDDRDWGHFPEKLNFQVKVIPFNLEHLECHVKGWKHLSRIVDVSKHSNNRHTMHHLTMYVDSDVFWFRDPLPLDGELDKFCFDGWNTGFYYYDRTCMDTFIEIFDAYTRSAIYSKDIREIMKQEVGYDAWYGVWDEMICAFMLKHHPDLFYDIPLEEHASARTISEDVDKDKVKMFHCNGTMVANEHPKTPNEKEHCRGLLGLLVEEFYENMTKVLDEEDMQQIYSDQERIQYLPHQFSLLKNPHHLCKKKTEDGRYQMILKPLRVI